MRNREQGQPLFLVQLWLKALLKGPMVFTLLCQPRKLNQQLSNYRHWVRPHRATPCLLHVIPQALVLQAQMCIIINLNVAFCTAADTLWWLCIVPFPDPAGECCDVPLVVHHVPGIHVRHPGPASRSTYGQSWPSELLDIPTATGWNRQGEGPTRPWQWGRGTRLSYATNWPPVRGLGLLAGSTTYVPTGDGCWLGSTPAQRLQLTPRPAKHAAPPAATAAIPHGWLHGQFTRTQSDTEEAAVWVPELPWGVLCVWQREPVGDKQEQCRGHPRPAGHRLERRTVRQRGRQAVLLWDAVPQSQADSRGLPRHRRQALELAVQDDADVCSCADLRSDLGGMALDTHRYFLCVCAITQTPSRMTWAGVAWTSGNITYYLT